MIENILQNSVIKKFLFGEKKKKTQDVSYSSYKESEVDQAPTPAV